MQERRINPTSLKYLALTILLCKCFPHMVLQVAIADVMHMFNGEKWINNNTVPLQINIPSADNLGGTVQFLVEDARSGRDSQQIRDNGNDDTFNEYLDMMIPCIMNISYPEYSETWNRLKLTLRIIHIL